MDEMRNFLLTEKLLCILGVINLVMPNLAAVTPSSSLLRIQTSEVPESQEYSWSSWGRWTPCSNTCGGGVAIQERTCLERSRSRGSNVTNSLLGLRMSRQVERECEGLARRYHECNTALCPGEHRDPRAEQCSSYDARPFRGRFYTWIPYIDGNSPCTLNCRPRGQQFYASLALAADGTPCTKPGFRAICVQGNCQAVGRDSVLAEAGFKESHCGRRLVSGLFSRARLPLGYSYVTTVPKGACRLNISEIISSDNYIALKISNGSYIMNGEFAVSAPGTYDAAGARFIYSRILGQDSVFALGPIHTSIDIMILYTQPNPNIKYEYLTQSIPGDTDMSPESIANILPTPAPTKHTRRHHSYDVHPRTGLSGSRFPDISSYTTEEAIGEDEFPDNIIGSRRFMWKILSYSQCTRSCGGGIQVGKFRCVEASNGSDKEVSPIHCIGSPPPSRRRRCGNIPCPPKWRTATWSACPKCGPALRNRVVGCVQDNSKGITKVSDHKCTTPKPATTEACDIPDCEEINSEDRSISNRRVVKSKDQIDAFRDGPVYSYSVNTSDIEVGPEYSFAATAGWLYTDWSECVGWCVGGGIQTRNVRCADPSGCAPRKPPETSRTCTPKGSCEAHVGHWFTGEWSACSSECNGRQRRGLVCVGESGRHLRDAACPGVRPEHEKSCGTKCAPTCFYSDWSQCKGNCSSSLGFQSRTAICLNSDDNLEKTDCLKACPLSHRPCTLNCTTTTTANPVPVIDFESTSDSVIATTTEESVSFREKKECEDKLPNCGLAVQARLCHYNFYVQNCCDSCRGR